MKKIIVSLISTVIFLCTTESIFAMTPTWPNDARFSRGVSNTCYYISSSASSYTSKINAAADNWVNTGYGWNPIYMTPVSSNYATHIDVYVVNPNNDIVLNDNTTAYTSFWSINSLLLADLGYEPSVNYFYTEIIISQAVTLSTSVIIHEMGHCFGLRHSNDNYSIMYPFESERYVTRVQRSDHDTINYLY